MTDAQSLDAKSNELFAGLPVRDFETALDWYQRFLGAPPSFLPNEREAVWALADHRWLYIIVEPERAGGSIQTIICSELEPLIEQITLRGINFSKEEQPAEGVRKVMYHDPDGNEIGLGRVPRDASVSTLEIAERFHYAFEAHRPEDLDALIGEGCVLENTAPAPDGARYEGREDCLEFWKGIASNVSLAFTAEEIWASEDRGFIRWGLRWGEGADDRIRGVNIIRVRDGRIVQGLGYSKERHHEKESRI